MPFKTGKWRLQKVNVKQNKPSSYSIVFWSDSASLKDLFGNDELSELDWSSENHEYSSDIVRIGLVSQIGLNIKYTPLVKKRLYYNSNVNDNTITEDTINIAYQNGQGDNGILWNDLKPSIKLIRAIELIEQKYGVTFSRDFFGKDEFTNLFFWCNNKAEIGSITTSKLIDWSSGSSPYVDTSTDIGTFPLTNINYFEFSLNVTPDSGYESVPYTLEYYENGDRKAFWTLTGTQTRVVNISSQNTEDKEAYYKISSELPFSFQSTWEQTPKQLGGSDGSTVGNIAFDSTNQDFDVATNVPKIKVIDFFRGLLNMFKLIVEPNENEFYVDTFNRYYDTGNIYDITNYVDFNSVDVNRGEILNEINYKFKEPNTILNTEYERLNGVGYGDVEFKLTDDNGEPLDGDTKDYEVPFEQIVYERLNDVNDNAQTDFMYGLIADENLKAVNPKMHIHYIDRLSQTSKRIGFIDELGFKDDLSNINTATHVDSVNSPLFSTTFETNIEEYTGVAIQNTLYSIYHSRYISAIFNIKRRSFNYKAILPLVALLEIKLNDVIQINSNYYRINNFTTNLVTQEASFNLINNFDSIGGGFTASPTQFIINSDAQQLTTFVTNLGEYTFNKVDNGFGTDWVTVSDNDVDLLFDVEENNTGTTRNIFITFQSTTTLQEFTVFIQQGLSSVLWSNEDVTWDNITITWDNI